MGLDVYLYKYEDYDKEQQILSSLEDTEEDLYKKHGVYQDDWKQLSEAEQEKRRGAYKRAKKKLAEKHGLTLDKYDEISCHKEQVEHNSERHPKHMFKIGYLRSSYNDGGINNVLENLIGMDLWKIFGVEHGEYHAKPNWDQALARCQKAQVDLKEKVEAGENLRCIDAGVNMFTGPNAEVDKPAKAINIALEQIRKHKARPKDDFMGGSWSNRDGIFFMDKPLQVLAAVGGVKYGTPCVYMIYREDMTWYLEALEVCEELCQFVLSDKDRAKYVMHWSG